MDRAAFLPELNLALELCPIPVSLLPSARVRLYRVSCPVAEAQGEAPQREGRMVMGLMGSQPVLTWLSCACSPWKPSPSVCAALLGQDLSIPFLQAAGMHSLLFLGCPSI